MCSSDLKVPLMDQEVFNQIIISDLSHNFVDGLPEDKFVIGREINQRLTFSTSSREIVAVHANYIVGQKAKLRLLKLVVKHFERNFWSNRIRMLLLVTWEQSIRLPYFVLRKRLSR